VGLPEVSDGVQVEADYRIASATVPQHDAVRTYLEQLVGDTDESVAVTVAEDAEHRLLEVHVAFTMPAALFDGGG
jgi:hypothetical protein